ncbi:amino acid permease-associated protein [Candidatus Nitrosoglobus terrae]|uniref:Amino acid permease-associated protein n=1 Tax=Candidatus Nitrosoglobus terrae TaxID=1630141 RepID=A0A1Q2SJV8_9GAMM|nr:amino acid permease [Candidatus Nitrosoglobus terrae]BAW79401.1 amino acid permease-associated protein [Candidatus Nitrosoglobus terrae]
MKLFRTKPIEIDSTAINTDLKRVLGSVDLVFLGVGAIIGAGIFVLTGIAAANYAGPAVVLSFVVAGIAVTFAALSYAELATSIGGAGSAYGYSYAGLGEFVAWMIGWMLILEYSVAIAAVSVGWSGYINNSLAAIGIHLPEMLIKAPSHGGWINLPAMLIILVLGTLLATGAKVTAKLNAIMVLVKIAAILLFISIALFHVNTSYWTPFMPFGWEGVMTGAASIFFAYIGFDAVSTAAEETQNPQKDLPIGILGSLAICTLFYMLVATLLTGIVPYSSLDVPSPVSDSLLRIGVKWASGVIAIGAIVGLTTVILVLYFGLTRIIFAISRDGLLPPFFSYINKKTSSPVRVILLTGLVMASIAGLTPLNEIVELTNIGTLGAFTVVCAGVAILRYTKPDLQRPFKTPFSPGIPLLGILSCGYLVIQLSGATWIRFSIWLIIGLVIYFTYSYHHSKLSNPR